MHDTAYQTLRKLILAANNAGLDYLETRATRHYNLGTISVSELKKLDSIIVEQRIKFEQE
jgi:hypothetical protein